MSYPRIIAFFAALGLASVLSAAPQTGHEGHNHAPGEGHGNDPAAVHRRTEPWPASILEVAESLPIQDGGRIKPLHTYAAFTLLRIQGKRSVKTPEGDKLTPMEWLLDTLYFPDMASEYELFQVRNDEVVHAIGLSFDDKRKSDRYSYNELREGVPRLFELARKYGAKPEAERDVVEQQLFLLANNVNTHIQLIRHMDFARARIPVSISGPEDPLTEILGGATEVGVHDVLEKFPDLARRYQALAQMQPTPELEAVARVIAAAEDLTTGTGNMALLAPSEAQDGEQDWSSPADLFGQVMNGERVAPEHIAMLSSLAQLADRRDDMSAFEEEIKSFHALTVQRAEERGEYEKIGLELSYYKSKILSRSLYMFVGAFLVMAFMWLRPKNRFLHRLTSALVFGATLALVATIVMRCVIRGRPPVSTLYETVLFVTAVGAIVCLCVEAIGRRRIAISAAAILGTVGLFIANGYEVLDKQDTMPSLVAVLDTNFWLATHVTSITIGYSAGMLAALLGSGYVLGKALRFKANDRAFYKSIARMTYGVLAFGLIFAVVGTILGGVWANDSWGRFWGWDPKENGALLICLSQIAILHGRLGGFLRDHGLCMAAAFGGTIVAFSWWGVNLLGVGLHSYGFTSGISQALWIYYGIQWGIVGIGAITWWFDRHPSPVNAVATEDGAKSQVAESV